MWDWKLTGYYNYADFYDLFGPTKVSRKGESLKLAHSQYLDLRYCRARSSLDWSVAGYSDLERAAGVSERLHQQCRESAGRQRGAEVFESAKGRRARWMTKKARPGASTRACITRMAPFRSVWGNYDRGFLLPRNSAFWLRASAGKSFGDFTSPFSSFYFGAFGNNYIDHLAIDRYREYYSFPGRGHRCDRRAQFRQAAGRIQSAAHAIPRARDHLGATSIGRG